ncbi:MAG TPA: DUF1592 domain-containing protein [Polyangiaceae bacterium]|nr:DUF1592 domain-containing protein [Polyangiaceae bacterium]
MKNSPGITTLSIAVGLVAVACTGSVVESSPSPGAAAQPGGAGQASGGAGAPPGAGGAGSPVAPIGAAGAGNTGGAVTPVPGVFTPSPSRLRRLTSFEYKNSVIDLLGAGTQVTVELDPDDHQNNLTSVAASTIALSATITEQFEASAFALAEALAKDTARRQKVVGCTPTGAADEACMRTFVTAFGKRAFRRPLTTEEVDQYVGLGKTAMTQLSDFWGGVQYALAGLLQSPNFVYRTEIGVENSGSPTKRALSDYELASRLSYMLWSTTPDDALMEAAANGTLSTDAGLQQHTERLLASPRSQESLMRIFTEMLRLHELDSLVQVPTAFPAAASATLGSSFRTETQNVLRDIVLTRNADYREFFTGTQTSANAELAKLYGVTGPTGSQFVSVTLPASGPRAGYLGQGSFLALEQKADNTSPTRRGKFLMETVLCNSIPPPPENADTDLPVASKNETLRKQLEVHMADPTCAGCHAAMDPLGLALEHFDGIGAYRENDRGMTLDVSGELNGVKFNGARELGKALATSITNAQGNLEVTDCLVRNLYRVATGRVEQPGEEPVVGNLSNAFTADGFKVRSIIGKLVASEGFRFVGTPG